MVASITEADNSGLFVLADEWDDELAKSAKPYIELYYKVKAKEVRARVGASPDNWSVVNERIREAVDMASMKFAKSTNDTTSMILSDAIAALRDELKAGLEEGDPIRAMTRRVQSVFDEAEKSRALTIASTEVSRATHQAQVLVGEASGVVVGYRWLLSDDACPVCMDIAEQNPVIKSGGTFATVGSNPDYSVIKFPPAHPNCRCAMTEILDTDPEAADL
jgi:hypothetical protein